MKIAIIGDVDYRTSIREMIEEFDDILMGDENLPIPSNVDVIICQIANFSKSVFDSNSEKYFILSQRLYEIPTVDDWAIINSIDYYKLIAHSKNKMDLIVQLLRIQNIIENN